MNSLLVTASDQYTEKILAYQEQEKVEIAQLKKDRLYLLKQIDEMKEDKCSLEVQVRRIPAHPHVKALAFRELWDGLWLRGVTFVLHTEGLRFSLWQLQLIGSASR